MPRKTVKGKSRRTFGAIRQLPSGRFQASYEAPDMGVSHQDDRDRTRYKAPHTFRTRGDAEAWLDNEEDLVKRGKWTSPAAREEAQRRETMTVKELCETWLTTAPLKPSTVDSHRRRLERRVYCTDLADEPISLVTRDRVKAWWAEVQEKWPDTGNTNAYAYKRLRTAFSHAVHELEALEVNPVNIKKAGTPPRSTVRDRPLITPTEAQALIDGVSARMSAPVAVLLYTGLRIGELLELRRKDIDGLAGGTMTIKVRRSVARITETITDPKTGETRKHQVLQSFDSPKTDAGNRNVVVPDKIAVKVREHCKTYMGRSDEALFVTTEKSKQMFDTSFRSRLMTGKKKAGREDIGPHDLRRYYGTMLVTNGVPMDSARRLMGHETIEQLARYFRSASGYEKDAASVLDRLID